MPQTLEADSHVFVDHTAADGLEEVFAEFQAEGMTEMRTIRIRTKNVRHTSVSVGDLVIDETGYCFAVMPVGFKRVALGTLESRTELALHLLSLGLGRTPGWSELFEQKPALLAFAVIDRLRNDAYGVGSYARKPYGILPAPVAP